MLVSFVVRFQYRLGPCRRTTRRQPILEIDAIYPGLGRTNEQQPYMCKT
jgi:hypothetical protein